MKPIIFSSEMMRAILEERKTQTRRVIKPQPTLPEHCTLCMADLKEADIDELEGIIWTSGGPKHCSYGRVGDRLWVRETFCQVCYQGDREQDVCYKEDCETNPSVVQCDCKWTPSIHMPRWASRITLEITDIRVERLQEISIGDAEADTGIKFNPLRDCSSEDCISRFESLWDSLNAKRYPWESNPWVWVLTFRRVE